MLILLNLGIFLVFICFVLFFYKWNHIYVLFWKSHFFLARPFGKVTWIRPREPNEQCIHIDTIDSYERKPTLIDFSTWEASETFLNWFHWIPSIRGGNRSSFYLLMKVSLEWLENCFWSVHSCILALIVCLLRMQQAQREKKEMLVSQHNSCHWPKPVSTGHFN